MPKPTRLKMSRKRGFDLQKHSQEINGLSACLVSRSSKFGNPFKLKGDMIYVWAGFRRKILSEWVLFDSDGGHTIEEVIKLYRDMLMDLNSHEVEPQIREKFKLMRDRVNDLRGLNLCCYCKIGEPCHADVLLELANCYD